MWRAWTKTRSGRWDGKSFVHEWRKKGEESGGRGGGHEGLKCEGGFMSGDNVIIVCLA